MLLPYLHCSKLNKCKLLREKSFPSASLPTLLKTVQNTVVILCFCYLLLSKRKQVIPKSAFCYSRWFCISWRCDGEAKKHLSVVLLRAGNPEGTVVSSTSSLWWSVFCFFFLVIHQNMSPTLVAWRSSNENRTNLEDETNCDTLSFEKKCVNN